MNINKACKNLVFQYYLIYALLILELVAAKLADFPVLLEASAGYIIRVVTVMFLLVMIPLVLKFFSIRTKYNKGLKYYIRQSKIEMWLLSLPAFLSGLAYYVLKDTNILFCYLIAFVALIFTKPSISKIEAYLQREKEDGGKADKEGELPREAEE